MKEVRIASDTDGIATFSATCGRYVAPWVTVAMLGCSAFDAGLLRHRTAAKATRVAGDAGRKLEPGGAAAVADASQDELAREDAQAQAADAATSSLPGLDAGRDARSNNNADAAANPDEDAGGAPCRPSTVAEYCTQMPGLSAAPVIDGTLDCGPTLLPISPAAWNGKSALPASLTASWAVAHRPDGIYVYVEVRGQASTPHPSGQAIYCGDAIELYLDGDGVLDATGKYDNPGTIQLIAAAPALTGSAVVDAERFLMGTTQGAWRGDAAARILPDGYAIELFLRDADLGLSTWSPSVLAGIDLAIDVSGSASDPNLRCGLLIGQFFVRVGTSSASCSGEPWCDSLAFCTPMLL